MRFGGAAAVATALCLALAAGGCGGGNGDEGLARAAAQPPAAERSTTRARPAAGRSTCRRRLDDLLASMDALRSRLAVGLSYEDYLAAVRGAKAAYARVDVDRLELGCVALAGDPAERALNAYIGGVNYWGDCLAEAACSPESVEPALQRQWQRAAAWLAAAQHGLRRLLRR